MAIKIGHASIDENGKAKNGKAGDQTGKEVCIRTWYSKPWTFVLRCKDSNIAESMARACEDGCNNPNIGYDQNQRNTAHTQAQKVGYDLSKINVSCETDCSAFMTLCAIAAGIKSLEYTGNAPTTSTMKTAFLNTGMFDILIDTKYLTSDAYLRRGDILVKPGSHTAMVLEDGENAKETPTKIIKGIDVSAYNNITDYNAVKNDGVKFAILKVIRKDLQPDKLFEKHWAGFESAGVPIQGVYNYSYATTAEKFKTDAKRVVDVLNGRKTMVWLDIEDDCQKSLGKTLADGINAYAEIIRRAGLDFGVYTGLSFYNSYLKSYSGMLNFPFWIARYPSNNAVKISYTASSSKRPNIGKDLYGWQYSSKGSVDGISGSVDLNEWYADIEADSYILPLRNTGNEFCKNLASCLGMDENSTAKEVLKNTVTISATKNRNHKSVTAIERLLKSLGYYSGQIEVDVGKTPCFGNGCAKATMLYQSKVVGLSKADGEWTAGKNSYKKALGI